MAERSIRARGRLNCLIMLALAGGLTSGCSEGEDTLRWRLLVGGASPTAASPRAVAYDQARGRLVVFGGTSVADTWEFDGHTWQEVHPVVSPPPLHNAAACYSPDHRAIFLFGGEDDVTGIPQGSLWRFDGQAWTAENQGEVIPLERSYSAMTYDTARHCLILFGGAAADHYLADTWEWSGGVWRQVQTAAVPAARALHSLIYDPVLGRTILFGGNLGNVEVNDTWAYDGEDWTPIESAVSPAVRAQAALTVDPAAGSIVLFGGADYHDLWRLEGNQWRLIRDFPLTEPIMNPYIWPESGSVVFRLYALADVGHYQKITSTYHIEGDSLIRDPSPRQPQPYRIGSMAYDESRGRLIYFSPFDGGGDSTTWSYHDGQWDNLQVSLPEDSENSVFSHPFFLEYDRRRATVIYMMDQYEVALNQFVWYEFAGEGWTRMTAAVDCPYGFRGFAHAFDPDRNVLVLFGGQAYHHDASEEYLAEQWEYDGLTWERVQPIRTPSARRDAVMAYDESRHRLVLFGGRDASYTYRRDTWEYAAATWTLIETGHAPAWAGPMVFDRDLGSIVLGESADDAYDSPLRFWQYDGQDWRELEADSAVPQRVSPSMVYNPATRAILLFGGEFNNDLNLSDLWELRR